MMSERIENSIDKAWVGLFLGLLLIGGAGLVAQYSDPSYDEMVRGDIIQVLPDYVDGTMMAGDFGQHQLAYIDKKGDFYRFTDSYDSDFNGPIKQVLKSGEDLIVGGQFTAYGQSLVGYIAKLNSNGELNRDFARNMGTGFDEEVTKIFVLRSGDLVVTGLFKSYNGYYVDGVAYLRADGSLHEGFPASQGLNGQVLSLTELSNGDLILGGDFTAHDGKNAPYLLKIAHK
ncbi:MAG: delta-60 repeat domain-containing protein [Bdellovibrionales bacterium]|nr:delta-60 repeat domain-containing protein [Bdellovibrionales bacterium]